MTKQGAGLPTFLLVGIASFMAALDNLVVTTALPRIRDDFHTSLESLEWTVNAYTLTFAVFLLTAAILGDRFGRRAVLVTGIGIFTVASAAAALSTSATMLVVARTVQGAGGAVIFPLALTLLIRSVPDNRRGMAIAGLSGMTGIAIALGPLVGGLIVQFGNWHWIFWLNVPIGAVLIPLALMWLRESHGPHARLDVRGTLLVTAGLLGLVYGLIRSGAIGWAHPQVIVSLAVGVLLLAGFVWWELRAPTPVVPPHLFRSRGFTLSNLTALLQQGGMFGAVFLLMQFLQNVVHYSPLSAGLRTLPWTVMPLFVAPLAAIFAERFGVRMLMVVSGALQALALGWIAVVAQPDLNYLIALPGLLFAGLGMGMFFALSARQTLDFVGPVEEGLTSGVNNAMRQVGVVLGIATLAGVFAATGGYGGNASFMAGLRPALWTGCAILVAATVSALATPAKPTPADIPETRKATAAV